MTSPWCDQSIVDESLRFISETPPQGKVSENQTDRVSWSLFDNSCELISHLRLQLVLSEAGCAELYRAIFSIHLSIAAGTVQNFHSSAVNYYGMYFAGKIDGGQH